MSTLIFNPQDVIRVIEHAKNSRHWRQQWTGIDEKTGESTFAPEEMCICLVHDEGVYLMSGGEPRDIVSGERSFVAYARGMDPDKDPDWFDTALAAVGGDDFGEFIHASWMEQMLTKAKAGLPVVIQMNKSSMRLL